MLITKTVKMKWSNRNVIWYKEKGYIFTNYKDEFEVKVEDLPDGSNVFVEVECDGCGEILKDKQWIKYKKCVRNDGKYYCKKCAVKIFGQEKTLLTKLKQSKSFEQWCYGNLLEKEADKILLRWSYNLNIDKSGKFLTPKDISYGSRGLDRKGYWFNCLDHLDHIPEQKRISAYTSGKSNIDCNQCNSISLTHHHLIKYLVNKEDENLSMGIDKKIPMKCPDCGFEKNMAINTLRRQGFSCNKCGDGVSYPNKIGLNLLEQLGINFTPEYSPNWIKPKRYDFYFDFDNKKYILEMDGGWHKKDNKLSGQTKEESKIIDDYKDRLAFEHDIEVIRIDCENIDLEYIKNNILNSKLAGLFDFNNIDWLKCHEFACGSLVKLVCDLWEKLIHNTLKIAEDVKISRYTTIKYLKQGAKLGWCNYDPKEELLNNYIKQSKKVICLTTKDVFKSVSDASRKYNIKTRGISFCCGHKAESAGKHPETGEKMVWMYLEDYEKMTKETEELK